MTIHLCVLEAYDKVGTAAVTLYYATKGFTSTPSDTPANTFFDPRIVMPASIRRTMFAPGRTFGASQVGFGDLVLANEDGDLDFLEDYAFDGRSITQYRGDEGSAFPGGYTKVLVATMEQAVPDLRSYRIKIRDRQDEVDIPFQPTKYAGNNALPAGLEGVAGDLKGKPKPICYGVVKNISPPLVNTSKLIYQVNDGVVASVDEVYDSGIKITRSPSLWNQETTPSSSNQVNAIGYDPNANRWVAVLDGGALWTSDNDGATWTARTSSFSSDAIFDVLWAEELSLWVAVGNSGKIATSSNGTSWTQRTNTFSRAVRGIGFDGTTLVAVGLDDGVGGDGEIETSTNGTSWTTRSSGVSENLLCVHFGRGLFVAGANDTSGQGHIITSPDGTTWTETTQHPIVEPIQSIAFGRGRFVLASKFTTQTAYSDDGISWTLGGNFGDTAAAFGRDVFYSELLGRFILAGNDGSFNHVIASSVDASRSKWWKVDWTNHDAGFGTSNVLAVHGSANTIILGAGNGKVATLKVISAYSTEANMLDDDNIPSPGTYKPYLTGGYIRLGSPPAGLITADVTQGAAASDRTAGQIFTDVLLQAGLTSADWTAGDITTLDSSIDDVIGYWSGTAEVLASAVLNLIAESVGGWWGIDAVGSFRIKELLSPAAVSSVLTITRNDMVGHLRRIPPKDPGRGIPSYRSIVRHSRNYTVQDRDLAGGVTDVRRAELAREWAEEVSTDATVQTAHLLAREQTYHTLLSVAADAVTYASRVQTLRGVRRSNYELAVRHDSDTEALDLGSIITIEHSRFGLSAGKKMAIMNLEPEPNRGIINIGAWG